MAEDEFFKRIAETLVMEEPAGDRPLGTAARRRARAKPKAPTNEIRGGAAERSAR